MHNCGTNRMEKEVRGRFRSEMPVCENWAYFDHAAVGPLPKRAADAIAAWLHQASTQGDVHWPEWSASAASLRSSASELLACDPGEIALIPNTTFGINVVANGFAWKAGDSVVVLGNEFPSNLLPWTLLSDRGVEVRKVSVPESGVIDLDAIAAAMDSTTRIVSISWVGYASGYRVDIAKVCEIAHSKGARLFVDAIQGLGVFGLDVHAIPIDYLAADGHKWMLGPEGAGVLYIRQDRLEELTPIMTGWGSLTAAHLFRGDSMTLKPNASRYEGGSANHVGLIGLNKSLKMLLEFGCHGPHNPVERCVLENAGMIEEGLQRLGANVFRPRVADSSDNSAYCSGILSFEMPGADSIEVRKKLIEARIVLSVRHGRLRVATHAYNDSEDIERLLERLRELQSTV